MKYLVCILAVVFCASVAEAGCRNGNCRRTPVRNLVKNTGKVIAAPFKNHCGPNGCHR